MGTLTRWGATGLALAAVWVQAPPARADTFRAEIDEFAFSPDPIVIDVEDRVSWRNRGEETHTVTADDGSFEDDDVDPDDTYTKTFRQEGRFPYRCTRHGMTGVVLVGDVAGPPPAQAAPPAPSTPPVPGASEESSAPPPPSPATSEGTRSAPPAAMAPPAVAGGAPQPSTTSSLRASTTSTSVVPPPVEGQVILTPGEPPVFVPPPEEWAPAADEQAGGPATNGVGGGPAPAGRGWLAVVVAVLGAAGAGGWAIRRRSQTERPTGR